jgi:predicted outer membrane protein
MLKLSNPVRSLGLVAVLSLGAGACATGGAGMSAALAPHHQALHAISMASHVAEIEESQLALTRATTQQARDFAQRMITDHTAAMQMDVQMMANMGMSLPGMGGSNASGGAGNGATASGGAGNGAAGMDMARIRTALMAHPHSRPMVEDHMRAMQMLQGVTGAAFDQAFMNRQVMAHQMTLTNMDRMMASMGMTPQGGTMGAGATAGMNHGNMSGMNHANMPATREGMMMMHQQERAMVAMHLQMAQQMAGR